MSTSPSWAGTIFQEFTDPRSKGANTVTLFTVRVQVGQRGVLTVALESRPGLPSDEDEHLPGSDVAGRALAEPAQRQHPPSVPGNLPGRPA
jgi:hypothetical protein